MEAIELPNFIENKRHKFENKVIIVGRVFFYYIKIDNFSFFFRIFALSSCVEVAKKLGDNFLPLLPETIPFFAEMLEDENPQVEKECQKSVQELERVLGEPLQKYF